MAKFYIKHMLNMRWEDPPCAWVVACKYKGELYISYRSLFYRSAREELKRLNRDDFTRINLWKVLFPEKTERYCGYISIRELEDV